MYNYSLEQIVLVLALLIFAYCIALLPCRTIFATRRNPNEGAGSIASGTIAAEAGKQDKSRSRVEWPPYDQTHRRYLSLGNVLFLYFIFS